MNRNNRRLGAELLLTELWYIANGTSRWHHHHNSRPTRTSSGKGSDESPATIDISVEADEPLGITAHTLRLSRQAYIDVVENELIDVERRELSFWFLESMTKDARVLRRPYPIYQRKGNAAGYQLNLNKRPSRPLLSASRKIIDVAVVL